VVNLDSTNIVVLPRRSVQVLHQFDHFIIYSLQLFTIFQINFFKEMKKLFFMSVTLIYLTILSCGKDSTDTQATLDLRLTDGPGSFEAVLIDVIGAEVHVNKDTANASGWQALTVKKGVYDVLKLNNGVDTILGTTKLPLGDVSEIRLILGDNNSVKVGGQTFPLVIGSADKSGLKLKFEKKLLAGISYKVTLDFDAAKSVKEVKKGTEYKMKPILRLFTDAENGSIRGEIAPITCKTVIYAIQGTDTLTSSFPSSTGSFVLQGLNTGTYKVSAVGESPCGTKIVDNVKVEIGKATSIGKIQF
jgi:hypothetical protein